MYKTKERLAECLKSVVERCFASDCSECSFAESGCLPELCSAKLLESGAIFARAEPGYSARWFPVSEKLPSEADASEDHCVYAMFNNGYVVKVHWSTVGSEFMASDFAYWRPIDDVGGMYD